jgi:hypothetical protein
VHFNGPSPDIAWEENNMRTMQGKTAIELQDTTIELERYRGLI